MHIILKCGDFLKLPEIKREHLLILTLTFIALFLVSFFGREYIANILVGNIMDELNVPEGGERVLVIAPHSDDEALGAANLIKKSIQNGAKVKAVLVTNGDGFRRAVGIEYMEVIPKSDEYISYGYKRQLESINALKSLGMEEEDIIFLGYPDGGISKMWSTNWMKTDPYFSEYTKTYYSPYNNSYSEKTSFAGENLNNDLTKIIKEFKPTIVVYPHSNDRHPDHWAVSAFIKYSIACSNIAPRHEWLYLVHSGDWPTPLERRRDMYLTPPMSLLSTGTKWLSLEMSDEGIEEKSEVFSLYKSQIKRIGILMSSFERKNELFGEYPDTKLIGYERPDSEISADKDNIIIEDPAKDTLRLKISHESDILKVHGEVSAENNIHIFIVFDGRLSRDPDYYLNMVFFKPNSAIPLRLLINKGKPEAIKQNENSITDVEGITIAEKGKTLHIVIPGSKIGNYDKIFINAESFIKSLNMDRTAWRMVNAPPALLQ